MHGSKEQPKGNDLRFLRGVQILIEFDGNQLSGNRAGCQEVSRSKRRSSLAAVSKTGEGGFGPFLGWC